MLKIRIYFVLLPLIFFSCKQKEQEIIRSFYCWQSHLQPGDATLARLDSLRIRKLYVRFFDVSWDASAGQPIPVSQISIDIKIAENFQIVPVIFITNQSLQMINPDQVKILAFKISKLIEDLLEKNKTAVPSEIQIDCDWNEATRNNYFLLLKELQQYPAWKNIIWSATIRLHQIKFREKTGVPPVNRGALMFYNMGNVEDFNAGNSIYDDAIAKQYTGRIREYPLPLDAAIACYSWGLFFENEKLIKIFYPLTGSDLPDSLFQHVKEHLYTARGNFYFKGQFVSAGDQIKIETMSPALSKSAAALLSGNLKNEPRSVILYHLDADVLNQYSNEEFENIFDYFN